MLILTLVVGLFPLMLLAYAYKYVVFMGSMQAMGRVGEVITRTWQTADKMKRFRGRLGEETVRSTVVGAVYK